MLGSITPLGERGRGQRYSWTIAFFLIGSAAAGAGIGALLGLVGGALSGRGSLGLGLLAGLLVVGLAMDLRWMGARLPSVHRQVDETWLRRYRGWVYGLGFGFQLGLGVATIVTTSAVYAAFGAAILSGSVVWGAAIGGAFGTVRWLCAAAGGFVRTPADLACASRLVERLELPARRATLIAQLAALATLVGALVL